MKTIILLGLLMVSCSAFSLRAHTKKQEEVFTDHFQNKNLEASFNITTCVHEVQAFFTIVSKYEIAYESRLHKQMIDELYALAKQGNGVLAACGQDGISEKLSGLFPDQCINDLDTFTKSTLDIWTHQNDIYFLAKNLGTYFKVIESVHNSCPTL